MNILDPESRASALATSSGEDSVPGVHIHHVCIH